MVVCLTGGAGCGKSYVCDLLRNRYNLTIIDSDTITKSLYVKGGKVLNSIVNEFGPECLDENGELNRPYLAGIVFNNAESLEKLNSLTHPETIKIINDLIKDYKGKNDNLIILESAIAHRSGYKSLCDEFWYVYARKRDRINRLKKFRGYTKERIDSILKSQDTDDFFKKNCQEIIVNNDDTNIEDLLVRIDSLVGKYLIK